MNLLKTLDNGPHQSRVTSTKGHSIPPIRATTELTPRPMFRTEVGNNSTLIRYERASAPLTKNFPINNYMSVRNRFMIVRSLCNGAHDCYVKLWFRLIRKKSMTCKRRIIRPRFRQDQNQKAREPTADHKRA